MKDEIDGKIAHMPKEMLGIDFRLIMKNLLIDFSRLQAKQPEGERRL